jgi:hypothetical protein
MENEMFESRILEAIVDCFQKLIDEIWEWRMLTISNSMLEFVFKPPMSSLRFFKCWKPKINYKL